MGAKPKRLSPAKQREAEKAATAAQELQTEMKSRATPWPSWESKIDRVRGRDCSVIFPGWLAHIPEINPVGSPPREGISVISAVDEILPEVPVVGELVRHVAGARSGVLHEGFYLLHKAIHVQISCARSVRAGLHTWAVVDAYQASLFALNSILSFFGITIERSDNNFILIDVWGASTPEEAKKQGLPKGEWELCLFLRFSALDHFHKWAILKRLLRTLDGGNTLATQLSEAVNNLGDKEFARHRNTVHYASNGWIAKDLHQPDAAGPIKQAKSFQTIYDEIVDGTASGTVYLMCALIELACMFARQLDQAGPLAGELALLERRRQYAETLAAFDWDSI